MTAPKAASRDLSPDIERLRHNVRLDRVHYRSPRDLVSFGRKLRKHNAAAKRAMMASVSRFGIVLPILVDQHSTIIAGERIVEAALALGITEVPTLCVEHLDDTEVRLLRIALNKLGEQSEWNTLELAAEFSELLSLDVDLAFEVTGFETPEIDNLLYAPVATPEDPDDATVEVGASGSAVARPGDLWLAGDHRILCGSSLDEDNVKRLMGSQLAAMVMTDQPYNVRIANNVSGLGKKTHREFLQASGEMSKEAFAAFLITSVRALANACEDGALLYLYMDWRHMQELLAAIEINKLHSFQLAVWVKQAPAMGAFYRSQHELCFVAKKGSAPHRNNIQLGRFGRSRSNCWFYPGVNSFGPGRNEQLAMHPTCKQISMISDAIRDASHRGEIVLDGFLGSGTTLIAAERTSRICYGVELDPLYVDVILRRWQRATSQVVTLADTGETFEEVTARRALEPEDRAATAASPAIETPRPEIVARVRTRTSD